jgi:hypothetical protein
LTFQTRISGIVEKMPPATRKMERYWTVRVLDALAWSQSAAVVHEVVEMVELVRLEGFVVDSSEVRVWEIEDWRWAVVARVK